jgi:hypothetical protein
MPAATIPKLYKTVQRLDTNPQQQWRRLMPITSRSFGDKLRVGSRLEQRIVLGKLVNKKPHR